MSFRKKLFVVVAVFVVALGFGSRALAAVSNNPPSIATYDYNTGNTLIFQGTPVPPTQLCQKAAVRDCYNENYGIIFAMYRAVLDRDPDLGGWQFWSDQILHGLTVPQMAADFLGSPEAKQYGVMDNYQFVQTVLYNVSPPECIGLANKGGCANGTAIDNAVSVQAEDLSYGRITPAELVANAATFFWYLGSFYNDFQYAVDSLQKGYDLGQPILVQTISPTDYVGMK